MKSGGSDKVVRKSFWVRFDLYCAQWIAPLKVAGFVAIAIMGEADIQWEYTCNYLVTASLCTGLVNGVENQQSRKCPVVVFSLGGDC